MKELAATVGVWMALGLLISVATVWLRGGDRGAFVFVVTWTLTWCALIGLYEWGTCFSLRRAVDRALRPIREEFGLRSRALGCGPDAPFAWLEVLRRRGARAPASTGRLIRLWARAVDRDDPFAVPPELRRPF